MNEYVITEGGIYNNPNIPIGGEIYPNIHFINDSYFAPYIDETTGTWFQWDILTSAFINTDIVADYSDVEAIRVANENTRISNENLRIAQENQRVIDENIRLASELIRVSNENTRLLNESARKDAEDVRVIAENTRIANENIRIQSELDRISAENARVITEQGRVSAEQIRISNENARILTEQSRVSEFNAIKSDYYDVTKVDAISATNTANNAASNANLATTNANNAANEAITASERAENAAIEAENIADTKIDKTSIVDKLGTDLDKIMSQKATTEAIMKAHDNEINFFAYGVSRDLTGTGQTLTRVGNLSLHKTRPILSKVRGCVKNAQGVQYYLDNNTDFLKADGVTPSVLDGTDGDVMTEIPEMYVYEYTEGNYEYTYLSEFPLPNFKRIPKTYHGRYEGSYDTTTNQLRSVINSNIREGLPATGQSVFYYNSGAIKDRNLDWSPDRLLSHYVRALLFRVHYATYNSQATFNSALTAEGYLQGGLGAGVTDINGTKWSKYNGYNPFIPCGYTAELGNKTGVKDFYMSFEFDGYNTTNGDNTQYYKGIYNTSTAYYVNELVADTEDSSIGKGDGKLYKCILDAPIGTELTNTTYFALQTRTKTQANRFLVEIPFGHTFKQTIDAIVELTNNYTETKCYVYDNPAHFAATKTENARFLCNMPSQEGYIKLFNQYTAVPYSIGGSSGSWGYDYFYWRGEAGGALRGLSFGGYANDGSLAGLWYSLAYYSPSYAIAYFGVRLCFFGEGSKIE